MRALLALAVMLGVAATSGGEWFDAESADSSVVVSGRQSASGDGRPVTVARSTATAFAFVRVPQAICGTDDGPASFRTCIEGASVVMVRRCADGSTALDPLFRRPVDAAGAPLGPWEQVDAGGCPDDVAPPVVLTAAEFQRLPLTASAPSFQPADGRGLVAMPLVAYTDPAPQVLATTVLGVPVTVRARPTRFVWDFGDGSEPLTTSDPGRPWPDQSVEHPFAHVGSYSVTLTTTWSGEYQVNGAGLWLPVDGTATTTSTPFTATVEEARTQLVAGGP